MQQTHPYLATFTGLDVMLWVAAYAVWRYFASLGRVRRSAALPVSAPEPAPARQVEYWPAGRWATRTVVVQKMAAGRPRKVEERKQTEDRRQLKRAA